MTKISLRATGLALGVIALVAGLSSGRPAQAADAAKVTTAHAVALFGEPKYPAGFQQFDYLNASAPKGGTVRQAALGTFDSFNPYVLRGTAPLIVFPQINYDTLMVSSGDEPATRYGLVAESLTYPSDYAWVEFKLRKIARWHDGKPITPEDVAYTFDVFSKHGSPFAQASIAGVKSVSVVGPDRVRFAFKESGRRVSILEVSLMPILPKHYWQSRDFASPTIEPPLLSGPYKVSEFHIGRDITYDRVKDYWAKDLPVNRGRYNFDRLRYDFYRDNFVAFEAFKAKQADVRWESSQKEWATGYTWPAAAKGQVGKMLLNVEGGFLLRAFFFNLRNPKFQDVRVREALNYAFDFNWINKNYYYDFYIRTNSYFGPTPRAAASVGLPTGAELALLEPYRAALPPRVFTEKITMPDTGGTQDGLRRNLSTALKLFREAGYEPREGRLVKTSTGKPLTFEIIVANPEFQLAAQHWVGNLKLLGITATVRNVDNAQYISRARNFEFEVMAGFMGAVGTPGIEQRNRWSVAAADTKGSFNWTGAKSPILDSLIEKIVSADTEESYMGAIHALDRVLMWGFYTVPLFNGGNKIPLAYWDRFGFPRNQPTYDQLYIAYWWIDPAKDAALHNTVAKDQKPPADAKKVDTVSRSQSAP